MLKYLIYLVARLFNFSYRYRFIGLENIEEAKKLGANQGYLLAVWHQNLLQGILAQTGRQHVVIVSKSKDAEAVAFTCRKLGHKVARGSSRNKAGVDKGGKAAMDEMQSFLASGIPGALTVDGPKGPARIVKPGICSLALKTNVPIVPYMPIARNAWVFNSWDKFRLPKPFTIIDVYYGSPIGIDQIDQFDTVRDQLKQALDRESI
jgi:lysophospholipid acyltransferase (LPLAT)-like uncharacterized protein